MTDFEEIRKKYDSLTEEEKAKLYIIAVFKGQTKQLPSKPDAEDPADGSGTIDITPSAICGNVEEWEQLFILTQQKFKHSSFQELRRVLKDAKANQQK